MERDKYVIPAFLILVMFLAACSSVTPSTDLPAEVENTLPPSAAPISIPTEESSAEPVQEPQFALTSMAFAEGESIPDAYTFSLGNQCIGENISPQLSWSGAPDGTQSFALLMIDPDGGDWVHWVQFNIPAEVLELTEAVGGPAIGIKGRNSFGQLGYGGPCPPGGTHRYIFTIYALDTLLPLSESAKQSDVESGMEGHILGEAQLTGLRSR